MKNYGKISLGLDIGTNSVGWALVDENNELIRKNGFTFWGVRLFDESQSAEKTRLYRNSRRRLARRKQRLNILRNEFLDEINKVDPLFFQRLDDSFYKIEDKSLNNHYTYFDDAYNDEKFFKEYPTIYHLRKALISEDKKFDIRMIYLAIHHIMKYRGNFLKDGDVYDKNDDSAIINFLNEFNCILDDYANKNIENDDYFATLDLESIETKIIKLRDIMLNNENKNGKKKAIEELFKVGSKTLVSEFLISLLVSSKVDVSKLGFVKEQKYEKIEIDLQSEEFENKIAEAKEKIKELSDIFDLVISIKQIQDTYYLIELLGDSSYISEAMVEVFEKHKNQLSVLKDFIRKYLPEKYNEVFKDYNEKTNNYPKYVGINYSNGKPSRHARCNKEDFYNYIKKIIDECNVDTIDSEGIKNKNDILGWISRGEFLLRQNSGQNTAIPMQLNLIELEKIINNQKKYYSFFDEIKEGFSCKDRIISTFKYHIPYYVGPLNKSSKYGWVERNNEKVTPWNFNNVVNVDESAKKFIQRMQNKCTYLHGELDYCLPKKSILFSEFNCLQYLNKLTIDGRIIDVETKNDIFKNVFLKQKTVKRKDIENYLKLEKGYKPSQFTSKIEEVNCDMSSYVVFKNIFKNDFENNIEMIEEIIKDITIFEDKKILEKRLRDVYSLDEEKIKEIKGLNYKGYGKLSKHLLNFTYKNEKTGEIVEPIIQIMRDTNKNLQEILYSTEYNFIDEIDKYNRQTLDSEGQMGFEEYINEHLYVSPIMKCPLVQAYKIIEEIEKIIKQPIDEYYVECTRSNLEKKEPSKSRFKSISDLLAEAKKMSKELNQVNIDVNKLYNNLNNYKDNQNALRSDKLYLYFTQLGKCLYTLEDIDIEQINSGKYDIDHIYPQAIVKDDSISNRVLCKKEFNQNIKKDKFLCEVKSQMPNNINTFYDLLLKNNLISQSKYNKLTQKEVSEEQLNGFVNRQLVATNQAVKGLIELLKNYKNVDSSKIIYSKAENISMFRQNFDFAKSRLANNYHHAHDAYLNVVIGRILNNYYKKYQLYGYKDYLKLRNENYSINPEVVLNNYFKNKSSNGENVIGILSKNVKNRFDIHETVRTYRSNELFKKVSILPAGNAERIPVKESDARKDVIKYGGINTNSYYKYCVVKIAEKNENKFILEAIPKKFEGKDNMYLSSLYDGKRFEIINDDIRSKCVIQFDKKKFVITGKTNNQYNICNLLDRNFSYSNLKTIKLVDKYMDYLSKKISMEIFDEEIVISRNSLNNKTLNITKKNLDDLLQEITQILSKNIYSYSIYSNLCENIQKYEYTNMVDYCTLVFNLLKLLQTTSSQTADLTTIGLSKNYGKLTISKTLKPGMKIISESVTGYYSKVLFEVNDGI